MPHGAQVNRVRLPGSLISSPSDKCQPDYREDNKNNGILSVINRLHLRSQKSLHPKILDHTEGFVHLEHFIQKKQVSMYSPDTPDMPPQSPWPGKQMGKSSLVHSEQGCGPCLTGLGSQDRAGTRMTCFLLRATPPPQASHHRAELRHRSSHCLTQCC